MVMSNTLPVGTCLLLSMQSMSKEVVTAVVETTCHKQFGHSKSHYASICTNVTLSISAVIHISFFLKFCLIFLMLK